ncbi:MAG TPA: ABC transporter substrate-binding protein [Candidatus Ornithomonoglobus intestinigallinarum]|uniref:ABC transporter substrate-binding protein n=1 Tax=Candidatus Ornithomonoglobus intestinigallinarum TaxID=2840894 RepID=A0A9D1KPQ8_9FIRM|nr:ABC transporter substrate-binding protein [Candidatus Ornithomonoglobus intestinigallinarum]
MKKKGLKKVLALAMAAAMALPALAGCGGGGETAQTDDGSEQVTLKWVFVGPGEQQDSQKVWDKFNEVLANYLPNTTVEFECITSADYAEKWKLMSASQENLDIVWHGWMLPYVSEVKKGSYMELDELIDKVAPELYEAIPENIMDKSRVDGKLYSIPNMQEMVSYVSSLDFPIDIYEKYKDKINPEELANFFAEHETMDKESWDKIEEYIKMIKDGGDLEKGVYGFADHVEKGYEWISNPYKIKAEGDDYTPINLYRTPEYKTFVEVYADWFNKGYIRKDILTAENVGTERYEVKGGASYLVGQGYMPTQSEIDQKAASGDTAYVRIPFENKHYIPYAAAASNTAISMNSQHPERAMKLIALMNTEAGAELYNLLVYGIEGEHYKKINENEIQPIGYTSQPTSDSPYGQYDWAIGSIFNGYEIYMEDKPLTLQNDFIKKVNEEAAPSKLKGFTLDTDPIKIELAQVTAVVGEYKSSLATGAAADPMGLYEEFQEKLITAGDDKIVEEISRQIEEWRAGNSGGETAEAEAAE